MIDVEKKYYDKFAKTDKRLGEIGPQKQVT